MNIILLSDEMAEKQPDGGLLEACTMLVFDPATSTDLSTDVWHDVACASPETTQFVCKTRATGRTEFRIKTNLYNQLFYRANT